MPRWARFSSNGASTSRGSGRTRVYEVDININLFPYPLDLGTRPKAIFFHISNLSPARAAAIEDCLEDAHRAWPYLAVKVKDYFFNKFSLAHTVLRLFRPSQQLVEIILLLLTRGPSPQNGPTPHFLLGNDPLPHFVGLTRWCTYHTNLAVDGRSLDSFNVWTEFLGFPYMPPRTVALGNYFTWLQARMQAQPSTTDLSQLTSF